MTGENINWLKMTDDEVMNIANPIMDNIMQSSTEIDHEKHVKDFSAHLKALLQKRVFINNVRSIKKSWAIFQKESLQVSLKKPKTLEYSGNSDIQNQHMSTWLLFIWKK